MSDNPPTLEDALEGLNTAVLYCENQGWAETVDELLALFRRIKRLSADENDEGNNE